MKTLFERISAFFAPRPSYAAIAAQIMKAHLDSTLEDRLFDEWCEGPGKDWPTHTVMMRRIEGAPLEPCEENVEGWIPAFYEWAKTRGLDKPLRRIGRMNYTGPNRRKLQQRGQFDRAVDDRIAKRVYDERRPPKVEDKWVLSSFMLPADQTWCWVSDGKSVWHGKRDVNSAGGWTNEDTWEDFASAVTHWQAIARPEPPQA